jgi:hypothetical protein
MAREEKLFQIRTAFQTICSRYLHVERCDDCGLTRNAYNSCLMGRSGNGELAAT